MLVYNKRLLFNMDDMNMKVSKGNIHCNRKLEKNV